MSNALAGRNMFIWRLVPVLNAEMGVENFVRKAKAARLSGVWIKVADEERAREFIRLVKENEFEGYGFWHWMGAPAAFWEVLFELEA